MGSSGKEHRIHEIIRLWSRWLDLVRKIGKTTNRANSTSAKKYCQLHSSLMRRINTGLADETCHEHHDLMLKMQKCCNPWGSLLSFNEADKRLIGHLVRDASELVHQLPGRKPVTQAAMTRLITRCVVGGFVLSLIAGWGVTQLDSESPGTSLRALCYQGVYYVQRISPLDILPYLLIFVLFAGFWMLRHPKQY